MSILENTSMDMPTLMEHVPELTFVKEPDVQQTTETREISKNMDFAPITSEHIKDIQSYLKDNNDLNYLINESYSGPIDGNLNTELEVIAEKLEFAISKLINKSISKIVLNTTVKDLKSAVKHVVAYKKIISPRQLKLSEDQRIYQLGKLLLSQNKK